MSPIDPAIQAVLDELRRDVKSLQHENAELRRENEALRKENAALRREILASGVLYVDETSWRVKGRTSRLWCFTTKQAVYYVIDRTRGSPRYR